MSYFSIYTTKENLSTKTCQGKLASVNEALFFPAELKAPSLTKLFNKSLQYGIIPDEWKVANVVPVYKKGRKDCVENYRPISLLPLVSKVLERCVLVDHQGTSGNLALAELCTWLLYVHTWVMQPKSGPLNQSN